MPLVGGLGFRGDSLGFGFPVSVGSEFSWPNENSSCFSGPVPGDPCM